MQEEIIAKEQETEILKESVQSDAIAANSEELTENSEQPEKKPRKRREKKTEAPAPKETDEKSESKKPIQTGDVFETKLTRLYRSSAAPKHYKGIRGCFYIWDGTVIGGRVRITDTKFGVGNPKKVLGWVNLTDIIR